MPDEGTPLVVSSESSSSQSRFDKTLDAVKDKSKALVKAGSKINLPLQFLAILGGIALVISGLETLITDLIVLDFNDAIFEVQLLTLGFIIIVLESDKKFEWSQRFGEFIDNYVSILAFVSGRGIFYILIGTVKLTQVNNSLGVIKQSLI